jgi:uncharacterized protein (UPF0297 family)
VTYNPEATCVRGLEWFPTRQVDRQIGGVGDQSYSWVVDATSDDDVEAFYTYSRQDLFDALDTIDVYRVGDLTVPDVQVNRQWYSGNVTARNVRPAAGVYDAGEDRTDNSVNTSVDYAAIVSTDPMVAGRYNGATLSFPTWSNSVPIANRSFIGLLSSQVDFSPWNSTFSQWAFTVDDLDADLTGRRVLGLTVSCLCQRLVNPLVRNTEFDQPYRIRPALIVDDVLYFGQFRIMPNTVQEVSYTWFLNPATGLAWTEAELAAFASTAAVAWLMSRPAGIRIQNRTAGAIYQAWASVAHAQETRVATARRVTQRQTVGWNAWAVEAIGGGDWSKEADTAYLFNAAVAEQEAVDRRPSGRQGNLSMVALGDARYVPSGLLREVTARFKDGIPYGVTATGAYSPAFAMLNDDGVLTAESQVYATADGASSFPNIVQYDNPLGQFITFDADVDTPTKVRFLVRSETDDTPTSPLSVAVFDDVFNPEALTTPVDPSELENPSQWTVFERDLTETAWTGGDLTHVVAFFADTPGVGWQVQVLSAEDPTGADLFADGTFQGVNGVVAASGLGVDADACVVLGAAPAPPTGVDATAVNDDCFSYVQVEWVAPDGGDCDEVDRYEVQRQNSDGSWDTIYVVGPDTTSVDDFEACRNATSVYRVRQIATTTFTSDWSEPVSATTSDDCCGYVFTSNQLPELAVWYDDLGQRTYQPIEQIAYYTFEGRDGSEAVRPLRDALDVIEVTLFEAGFGAADPSQNAADLVVQGRRVFDPLLVLAGNKRDRDTGLLVRLPYLAVLDNQGNRWFASVETNDAVYNASGGRYVQQAIIREVTTTAAPVITTAAPVVDED